MPSFVRWAMTSRSHSATEAITLAIRRPVAVVVSTFRSMATRDHFLRVASAISPAKSASDRDSRSNLATMSTSSRRSLCSSFPMPGRFSDFPDHPASSTQTTDHPRRSASS